VPPVIATLPAALLRKIEESSSLNLTAVRERTRGRKTRQGPSGFTEPHIWLLHTETKTQVLGRPKAGSWELRAGGAVDFGDVLVEDEHLAQFLPLRGIRLLTTSMVFKVMVVVVVVVVISASFAVGVNKFNSPPPSNVGTN
jgi:hypothetical protein